MLNEVVIEQIIPMEDESLRIIVIIPKDNKEAQRLAMEAFFECAVRDLKTRFRGNLIKKPLRQAK